MVTLALARLQAYRAQTYRLQPGTRLTTPEAAVDFVSQRGFVYFWPVKGVELPSLWAAVAGDRPVADAHDDPGHVTWGWKDASLGKRWWYYAKILRRKATFISLEAAPYFYALSENYGSPEEDYLIAYQDGRLTLAAKQVYEALLDKGALDTLSLRKEARLQNARDSVFNRALEDLQKDFKILPVGVAEAGAWRYAFRYDVTARHIPELQEQARPIGEAEARTKLIELYFASVGAAQIRDAVKLFGWPLELVKRTVAALVKQGWLVDGVAHPTLKGEWLAMRQLAD
ncbi:MAG: winged helix DNA-binding domain-containing protein [Anaerolineales bacterium]|nr:winged helix DNA-binding domain-containing protein [Anaerolineales bacterium]